MGKMNDGGPAFPQLSNSPFGGESSAKGGMTMRDYFAAHAPNWTYETVCKFRDAEDIPPTEAVARLNYKYADAMLAARNGETSDE